MRSLSDIDTDSVMGSDKGSSCDFGAGSRAGSDGGSNTGFECGSDSGSRADSSANVGTGTEGVKVSIYTDTFNQERFIGDCLEGIVAQQTSFPFEAIVIDDASTDSNREIIEAYAARYPHIIKPIFLKENYLSQRRSKFRELFLPKAKGSYIAFCEGDDYWTFPGKLQAQVDFLDSHPDYSACFHLHDDRNITGTEMEPQVFNLRRSRRCGTLDILIEPQIQTATILYRKTVFTDYPKQVSADPISIRFNLLDISNWFNMLHAGKVYGFANRWSVYRINTQGISWQHRSDGTQEEKHLQYLTYGEKLFDGEFKGVAALYVRHLKMRPHLNRWTDLRRQGKYLQAVAALLKAFASAPLHFLHYYFNIYFRF